MKLGFSAAEEAFRAECADWLQAQMAGEFRDIKGITTLTAKAERRKEWEQRLAEHRVVVHRLAQPNGAGAARALASR